MSLLPLASASRRLGGELSYWAARITGAMRLPRSKPAAPVTDSGEPGISVVIPSRNGRPLLEALLPGVARELAGVASEIIVVDNGSSDGTAEWLREAWRCGADLQVCAGPPGPAFDAELKRGGPDVRVVVSSAPLSFARAVNRGIAQARFSRICLLNNDMLVESGFFSALTKPFDRVPDLFCATAQIQFPEGVRREETGKAVMADYGPEEFPIRCEEPLPGEDGTPVLYGSGGCSLYDAAKLRALGSVNEEYAPAYVEDLELGYRAWQRGWPSVYVAGAVVEHRHRATTSRYYTDAELDAILEINYLRFLAGNIADRRLFARLWLRAIERLRLRAARGNAAALQALQAAAGIALRETRVPDIEPGTEEEFLALTDGSVAVLPGASGADIQWERSGHDRQTGPGGSAQTSGLAPLGCVLVASADDWAPPAPELRERYAEIVLVRGGEASPAFRSAIGWAARKWGVDPDTQSGTTSRSSRSSHLRFSSL